MAGELGSGRWNMSYLEKPLGRWYANPSDHTRARQAKLDKSVYVDPEEPVPADFNVGFVTDYIAKSTCTLPREYLYRNAGVNRFVVIFPNGYVRDKFVCDEMKAKVNGVWVTFRAWKLAKNSMPFVYKKKVWIRVFGLPEHHYTFDKVEDLVRNFGRLVDIDEGKAMHDLSSLDALIDCPEVDLIPTGGDYHYDYYYGTKIRIYVDLAMDFMQFVELGLDNRAYSYVEVFKRAYDGYRAGLLDAFVAKHGAGTSLA